MICCENLLVFLSIFCVLDYKCHGQLCHVFPWSGNDLNPYNIFYFYLVLHQVFLQMWRSSRSLYPFPCVLIKDDIFFHIVNYFCGMPFSVECLFKLIYIFFHQNFIKIMLVFLVIKETVCEYWITTLCMFIFVFDDFSWLLLHLSIVPSKPSLSV